MDQIKGQHTEDNHRLQQWEERGERGVTDAGYQITVILYYVYFASRTTGKRVVAIENAPVKISEILITDANIVKITYDIDQGTNYFEGQDQQNENR